MKENITLARKGKYDIRSSSLWSRYIASDAPSAATRTSSDYMTEYNNWYASQTYGDFRIMKLINCKNTLPGDIYSAYVAAAQSEDLWEGTEYSWEHTAYVVERTTEKTTTVGPLLKTTWNQESPYSADGKLLGCVKIATGQIMKFFEYPSTFIWSNMPLSGATNDTRAFLARLKVELRVDDSGGATINDAERVLKSYGYSVEKKDHDGNSVFSHILKYRTPVYARGVDTSKNEGHAWVMDGIKYSERYITYTLFRLTDTAYPDFKYDEAENADSFTEYSFLSSNFHMNWGWGGSSNGWFYDNLIAVGSGNFNDSRKELYIHKP